MTKSILNILDNDCTKVSPCKDCPWHIQGIEKNRCVKVCQKLSAYRDNLEYDHLPWPKLEELQDEETEDKIPPKNKKHRAKLSPTLQKKGKPRDSMPKVKKTSVKRSEIDEIIDGIAKRIKVDPPKPQKEKKPNRDKVFKIYMIKYPEILQYIVETAEKSLLPTKDIFVQLLAESIIARKREDKL